jgi:hypothetical protein
LLQDGLGQRVHGASLEKRNNMLVSDILQRQAG